MGEHCEGELILRMSKGEVEEVGTQLCCSILK
jgi:hypothetical protein